MSDHSETGWFADLLYLNGKFESELAMFAGKSGRITRFSKDPSDLARACQLRRRAILPGLINCHSHSFQRVIRARTEHRTAARRDTFWTWREAMYHAANRLSPEDIYHVARMAFIEMLKSGITTVGEFHYLHNAPDGSRYADPNLLALKVLRAAGEVGLRIALLRTAYARAGRQSQPNPAQARFITPTPEVFLADTDALVERLQNDRTLDSAWVGIAPHSIRALPTDYLVEIAGYARARQLPVHMHVAEQRAEIDECLVEHALRPVELIERLGVLDALFTAIHAIHITREEAGFLGRARARVCACPTTERNLGDGAVRADELGEAGVAICLGSDSNIQIDLLEDARLLEYHLRMNKLERAILAPDSSEDALAKRLFAATTEVGSAALKAPGGSLEIGRPADFFTIDLNDPSIAGSGNESLLSHVVFSLERTAIRDVFVNGDIVVQDGHHKLEETVTSEFDCIQRRLWN
ncbi:MAG: formimidoylglutamate deiminase [Acidobacteriaceae bacterium]|nr:formimidoylglutamate deiminase [Acidobacteriaceae bacterium]MBV9781062.1 formimidoylglutamate deiminase [Acidobacteriaceae bacterium]